MLIDTQHRLSSTPNRPNMKGVKTNITTQLTNTHYSTDGGIKQLVYIEDKQQTEAYLSLGRLTPISASDASCTSLS